MGKKELTEQALIRAWKQLERKSRKPVGVNAVCKEMSIKPYHVTQLLQGKSLTDFKLRHGIRTSPQETPYTPDQLLSKYNSVVSKIKKIPTWNQIKFETGIPDSTFKKRFGPTKSNIVEAYYKWLKKHKPKSMNLKVVDKWLEAKTKPPVSPAPATKTTKRKPHVYEKTEGRIFGAPLSFRNLIYEPTTEQGVVFLFGMISEELGFSAIEYVGTDFPDCVAKRFVDRRHRQQNVRIEFEYLSREFENHGHNPQNCDLIICWKHNWKNCPVEVLELSQAIKELPNAKK